MKDAFLQFVTLVRPHSRTRADGNAYADGELAPAARQRFEKHLRRCEQCSRAVAASREVKALLATLPTEQVPRSFRLTSQMVSAPAAPAPRRRNPAPLRFAPGNHRSGRVRARRAGNRGCSGWELVSGYGNHGGRFRPHFEPEQGCLSAVGCDGHQWFVRGRGQWRAGRRHRRCAAPGAAERASGAAGPIPSTSPSMGGAYSVPESARDSAVGQGRPQTHSSAGNAVSTREWLEIALLVVIGVAAAAWFRLTRNHGREHS